jgi:hypothetical protein
MISADDMGITPLNISDAQLSSGAKSSGFTEMSFSCMVYEALMCQKRICNDTWPRKLAFVNDFELSMSKYYSISDDATPIEQMTKLAAKEIVANMHILLRRPPYGESVHDDFDILGTAMKVLERSLQLKSPRFSQWAWKSWVKWYVLAVVLAELCAQPDSILFDKAYEIAQQSYEQHRQLIADGEKGMLWRPIVKLMQRVSELKDAKSSIDTQGEWSRNSVMQDANSWEYWAI